MQVSPTKTIWSKLYKVLRLVFLIYLIYQFFVGFIWYSWRAPRALPYSTMDKSDWFAQGEIALSYKEDDSSAKDKLVVSDMNPEQWGKSTYGVTQNLDRDAYSWEKELASFYKDQMLYISGSVGFYVIQAEPFHITLLKNPNVDLSTPEYAYLAEALAQYDSTELTLLTSADELSDEDREFYEKMPTDAESPRYLFSVIPITKTGAIDYHKIIKFILYPHA